MALNKVGFILALSVTQILVGYTDAFKASAILRKDQVVGFYRTNLHIRKPYKSSYLVTRNHTPVGASSTNLNLFGEINAFLQAAPYATAFIAGGLESSAADFVAQIQEYKIHRQLSQDSDCGPGRNCAGEKISIRKRKLDLKRTLSFVLYGGICSGIAYEWIYNVLFPRLFGAGSNLSSSIVKASTEIFLIAPLMTIPISYIINAAINKASVRHAISKYWHDVTQSGLLTTYCAMFGPFQVIVFTFVPAHLRIPFTSTVSFLWYIFLSKTLSRQHNHAAA